MPTPFAPSKIWQRQVDAPIKQDASYKMTAQDRGYIDSQIIGLETLLLAVIGTGLVGVGTADQFYVTNHTGNAAQWQTVAGDVSYASGIMTVTGVRGISIPNPTGVSTVLTYNGGSLSWTNVTSVLSSFGADLAGSTGTQQWLASISGPGGVGTSPLTVKIVGFQFTETQVNPTISQATRTSDATVYNMTLAPQGPWPSAAGNQTPGSLIVALAAPVGSGANARLKVTENGSTLFQVGNNDAVDGPGTYIYLGANASTPGAPVMGFFSGSPSNFTVSSGVLGSISNVQPFVELSSNGSVIVQGGTTSSNPANVMAALAAANGATHAVFAVTEGGTATGNNVAQLGQFLWTFGSIPAWGLWLGGVAATMHNATLVQVSGGGGTGLYDPNGVGIFTAHPDFSTPSTAITGDPVEGVLLYSQNAVANPAPGPSLNVRDTFSVLATLEAGATIPLLGVGEFSTSRRYTFLNQISGSLHGPVSANIPSGDGVTWVGNAQVNPSSAPTGGFILYADQTTGAAYIYNPGAGSAFQIGAGGGGTLSGVDVVAASSSTAYVLSISGSSGLGGAVPVGTSSHHVQLQFPNLVNQVLIEAGTQYFLANDGSNNLQINGISNVQIQTGSTPLAVFNGVTQSGLFPQTTTSSFMFGFYSNVTTGTLGADIAIQPQCSTNANGTGGSVIFDLMTPSGSGSEATFVISRGATYNGTFTPVATMCSTPSSAGAAFSIYGPSTSPGVNNYGLGLTSSRAVLNAPTVGGFAAMAVTGTNIVVANSTQVLLSNPLGGNGVAFQWLIGTQSITGSSGTFTLAASVYQCPIIKLTSASSPGTATVIFPNVEAEWIIDLTGMVWAGGSAILEAGSATTTRVISNSTAKFFRLICDGNSNMHWMDYT